MRWSACCWPDIRKMLEEMKAGNRKSLYEEEAQVCRNIKTLFNFDPPVTDEEIRGAALQFVRKVSGFNKPSKTNNAAFFAAVDEVVRASKNLLNSLETDAPPRSRAKEAARARARSVRRFSAK